MGEKVFSKRILTVSLIVIIIGVLIYFVFIKRTSDSSTSESSLDSSESSQKVAETPLQVKTDVVKRGELIIRLKSPGEAVTKREINMLAEVGGVVKALHIEESQHVKKGDLLVELDEEEYKLDLKNLEANRLKVLSEMLLEKRFTGSEGTVSESDQEKISEIEQEFEKARQNYQKGFISRDEFEKASKNYEFILIESGYKREEITAAVKGLTQADISIRKTQLNLAKRKIRAPFPGIVYDIKISPLEHVRNGSELFRLVNISRIQVHATVLESEISKMKVGREVDLKFSAYPGKIFNGKVKAISPVVNPSDKTCKVIIDVANPEEQIKPGMHVEVEIAAEIHKDRLLVPQEAILVREGRKLVFVVEDGSAKWRYIEVGMENENYAEVTDGVREGETVIVDGHLTLAHDTLVRVVK